MPYENRSWLPGRFPTGHDLGVLRGVAHPMPLVSPEGELYPGLGQFKGEQAGGTWKLRVTNQAAGSANMNSWSLWLTTTAAGN